MLVGGDAPQSRTGTGTVGGPPVREHYKRAVMRAAPRYFSVEVLPPTKFGSSFHYGLHVFPIASDDRSLSSNGSQHEYEVWRRWEDCLGFQDLLEFEYTEMARSKRKRLAAGKGVKKDGIYIRSDQAASFESLPFGPDANSVALDMHKIVPKLTKKGTFFRPSQAVIEQRGKEFKAMIEGLFDEDAPVLIRELRDMRIIRDFFGIWRQDKDLDRKIEEMAKRAGKSSSRVSITSSTFSMYFSSSESPLAASQSDITDVSPPRGRRQTDCHGNPMASSSSRASTASPTMSFGVRDDGSLVPSRPSPHRNLHPTPARPRTAPSCSLTSDTASMISVGSGLPDDVPIMFVSGDEQITARMTIDRFPGLQPLLEEEELIDPLSEMKLDTASTQPKRYSPPTPASAKVFTPEPPHRVHRSGFVFNGRFEVPDDFDQDSVPEFDSSPPRLSRSHARRLVRPSVLEIPRMPGPGSDSSRLSSISQISLTDTLSFRRGSETSVTSTETSDFSPGGSSIDLNKSLPDAPYTIQYYGESHLARDSMATVDSFLASSVMESILQPQSTVIESLAPTPRTRSFSVGEPETLADLWEQEHRTSTISESLGAEFYDPSLGDLPAHRGLSHFAEDYPGRNRTQSMTSSICTPQHYPKPFQRHPPNQFHIPWQPPTSPLSFTSAFCVHGDDDNGAAGPGDDTPSPYKLSFPERPVSPLSVISSPMSSRSDISTFPTTYTIKAVKEDAIVVLRVDPSMSWPDVRNKISEKFKSQEDVQLTKSFLVGYVPIEPAHQTPQQKVMAMERGRPRSSSTSSVGLLHARGMRTISSDADWQKVVTNSDGKLAFRILDRF